MQFGVDEAGKGPVIGSMFAAVVRGPSSELPDGVDDSKRLSATRREELADQLRAADSVDIGIAEIPPNRIDEGNMNDLMVAAHAEAIEVIAQTDDVGLCDAGDVNADRFADRVEGRIDATVSIDAAHGADETDDFVGAASIIAKSERERHVATLGEQFGEIGSGYPSDPTTRRFLEQFFDENGEFPPPTRQSWATCDAIRADLEQSDFGAF